MALGAINFAFRWSDATALLAQSPEAKAVGMGLGFLIAVFVVSTSINLALWHFISRRASKVAKWIQTMFYLIGLASFAWTFNNPLEPQGLALAISVVILVSMEQRQRCCSVLMRLLGSTESHLIPALSDSPKSAGNRSAGQCRRSVR